MLDLIVRLLAWAVAFWPPRPRGRHRKGAQAPASQPAPVAAPNRPMPDVWPPCVHSGRLRREARHGRAEPPPPPPPPSASPTEPPSEWEIVGPLVPAYVIEHEKQQSAGARRP